ncbi:TetR family transcriptional regulator [Glaciihabitans tibetensis]|uniref:TetR family transcriptional regulator n=1 Tax=Glaciihabitans tibetensis TaxID=1266600 RepID=A0A2T0V2C4_9MICO|nr:TetR/AcrR family transcriptional regulator [Glaciihabitans tibetensis]PRY64326.1 TetR family transcriptional regulator [Glaciihabitans tibetensis]
MDVRQLRTRDALARAIRDLASQRTLADITVTDVALHAGISRPTFYAHAASPGALLGAVLGAELQALREEFDRLSEQSAADETIPLERFQSALVEHVYRNAAIYRHNLRHRLPPELRDVLIDHIEWGLVDHLTRHPDIAPRDPEAESDAKSAGENENNSKVDASEARYREAALYSAMAASGTVAALETWLRAPDPLHPARAVSAIRRGTAEWWTAAR